MCQGWLRRPQQGGVSSPALEAQETKLIRQTRGFQHLQSALTKPGQELPLWHSELGSTAVAQVAAEMRVQSPAWHSGLKNPAFKAQMDKITSEKYLMKITAVQQICTAMKNHEIKYNLHMMTLFHFFLCERL